MSMNLFRGRRIVWVLAACIWVVNLTWLQLDTRPPVWDMAMHQSYAFNYIPGSRSAPSVESWRASGHYPPFVHVAIAAWYLLIHPDPDVAVLANIPATLLLLWAIYELAADLAGVAAARWACLLTALTPYLLWMSRETILDYWMSAWVAAALLILHRTRMFESRTASLLLGVTLALGLLTKWLFAGFLAAPIVYVCVRSRIWRDAERMVNLADSLLVAGVASAVWYLPNLPALVRFFLDNARIGAREGEPPIASLQSWIYYLRLLEGYQLFGVLFAFTAVAAVVVIKRKSVSDVGFILVTVTGGWLAMTLLRTKDPRFTMPLLGILMILPGTWIHSWQRKWMLQAAKVVLVATLLFQAYAINFGVSWMPQEIILARGYQGTLRWDWQLWSQHYFHILGPPHREDWKQDEILDRLVGHARRAGLEASLALVPDLPRFSAANFHLFARLRGWSVRVDHLQSAERGVESFDGFNYVIMKEGNQGIAWTTGESAALNKVIVDEHDVFRLVGLYPLPDGDTARLYCISRPENRVGRSGPASPVPADHEPLPGRLAASILPGDCARVSGAFAHERMGEDRMQ